MWASDWSSRPRFTFATAACCTRCWVWPRCASFRGTRWPAPPGRVSWWNRWRPRCRTGGQIGFYRTAAGAELDLVVEGPGERIGIEIKFSASPKPSKGFWQALQDLVIERAFVVAPVLRRYPLAAGVEVVPVWDVERIVGQAAGLQLAKIGCPRSVGLRTAGAAGAGGVERVQPVHDRAGPGSARHHGGMLNAARHQSGTVSGIAWNTQPTMRRWRNAHSAGTTPISRSPGRCSCRTHPPRRSRQPIGRKRPPACSGGRLRRVSAT